MLSFGCHAGLEIAIQERPTLAPNIKLPMHTNSYGLMSNLHTDMGIFGCTRWLTLCVVRDMSVLS